MAKKNDTLIDSLYALQTRMPRVLKALNADPSLALAAGANPILALQALGYELTPETIEEISSRARFGPEGGDPLAAQAKKVFKAADREFDLEEVAETGRILADLLTSKPAKKRRKADQAAPTLKRKERQALLDALEAPLNPSRIGARPVDPLSQFTKLHPVVAELVAYRQLQRRFPGFADEATFNHIRAQEGRQPISRLTFRLQDRETRRQNKK